MRKIQLPRHVAIIMDGNGRWAARRHMPRHLGHRAGVKATRRVIECCINDKIKALTLFAFSSENWRRPEQEVGQLMELFLSTLQREVRSLHQHHVRTRFIGDCGAFSDKLQAQLRQVEELTRENAGLNLNVAINYGGRWDIADAARRIAERVEAGTLRAADVTVESFAAELSLADVPEPDLFIRTGGEQRISNFLLWQLAYTELYFTDCLWPDFDKAALDAAFEAYSGRQRRFGRTGDQVAQQRHNA
ncbi:MAG: polyprenyl diphosphate synthase [Gammaproteobacteria bacterium]